MSSNQHRRGAVRLLHWAEPASRLADSLAAGGDDLWTSDPSADGIVATVMADQDSQLAAHAGAAIVQRLADHPEVEAFFTDTAIDGAPQLVGAWSPERIAARPDELGLVVARGVHRAGSLSNRLELLFALDNDCVGHLAEPLVHRRSPIVVSPEERDLAQALLAARRHGPQPEGISVIIPTAGMRGTDGPLVAGALQAALTADVAPSEVLLVVGDEYRGNPEELITDPRVRLVRRPPGPWSFSESINLGLLAAGQEAVLILNDDVEMLNRHWLGRMVAHLADPTVAAVGALLLYPDGTVQHAGMVIDDAFPLHCFVGRSVAELEPVGGACCRDMVAVTGACILLRRSAVLALGGLCEGFPRSFNDADLCLKLRHHGHRVILEPEAQLIHLESASCDDLISLEEWDTFVGRWGQITDPWYHPGFHRPDLAHNRRLNADHLPPIRAWDPGPLRRPVLKSAFPTPRVQAPAEPEEADPVEGRKTSRARN